MSTGCELPVELSLGLQPASIHVDIAPVPCQYQKSKDGTGMVPRQ